MIQDSSRSRRLLDTCSTIEKCLAKAIDKSPMWDQVTGLDESAEVTTIHKTLHIMIRSTHHLDESKVGISAIGGVEAVVRIMKTFPKCPALQEYAYYLLHNLACCSVGKNRIVETDETGFSWGFSCRCQQSPRPCLHARFSWPWSRTATTTPNYLSVWAAPPLSSKSKENGQGMTAFNIGRVIFPSPLQRTLIVGLKKVRQQGITLKIVAIKRNGPTGRNDLLVEPHEPVCSRLGIILCCWQHVTRRSEGIHNMG